MATREIIEIPDSKSGDINDIRDKKIALAKDAAAQSDLPQQLEYLIKNGQTGEFMNVLDSYINEKIRVALGNLAYSYAKESTMARVLGIDANKDLGSASLSSLASLLGVVSGYTLQVTTSHTISGSNNGGLLVWYLKANGEKGVMTVSYYDTFSEKIATYAGVDIIVRRTTAGGNAEIVTSTGALQQLIILFLRFKI